jgi:hypothetical protein
MRKRLEFLKAADRFSEADVASAFEIWQQGNEVLHDNTEHAERAPDVVSKTLRVIGALFPYRPPTQ